jgi:hypothetical protein
MATEEYPFEMRVVTDPDELARARSQDVRFERNWKWFEAHAPEIYKTHRERCLCIAGEELFVADTPEEALAQARAAHPDDDGLFTRIIPLEKGPRIYANVRRVVPLR